MKHNKIFTICVWIVATLFCNVLPSTANMSAYVQNFGSGIISGPKELGEFCVAYYHDGKLYNEIDYKWDLPDRKGNATERELDTIPFKGELSQTSDLIDDYKSDDTISDSQEDSSIGQESTDSDIIAMAKSFDFENCSQDQKIHLYDGALFFLHFKFVVYYPNTNLYYISPYVSATQYTKYSISYNDGEIGIQENDYSLILTVAMLILVMLITVSLELGVGWLFSYRSKKDVCIIAITNVITNLLMNAFVCHEYIDGNSHSLELAIAFSLILLEPLVWIIESIVYLYTLERKGEHYILRTFGFALVANVVSFVIGLVIISFVKDLIVSLFGF